MRRLAHGLGPLLLARALCAAAATDPTGKLADAPFPPVIAAAKAHRIPMEGIDAPDGSARLTPGDSLSALVTLHESGGKRTQWLLFVEAVAPDPGGPAAKPAPAMVLYSCLGNKLEFRSSPRPVRLQTLGPFTGNKAPKSRVKAARFMLDEGFLSLGLNHAAAAILRLKTSKAKGAYWFQGKPFTEAEVRKNRDSIGSFNPTDDEERALAGAFPALLSYFDIVQQTEGLSEILMRIIDRPSIWSVIRNGGVNPNIAIQRENLKTGEATTWGLESASPVFHVPIGVDLNRERALNVTLVVTTPQPPLVTCAGIVGLLAEKPGDKETYLTIRVISARRCEPNTATRAVERIPN